MKVSVKAVVDWSRSNADLAEEFCVSPVTVWRYKKRIGIPSSGKRGQPPKDRSTWDWSLRDVDLARIHKISRQRVGILRRRQRQINRKLAAHERANGAVGEGVVTSGAIEASGAQDSANSLENGGASVAEAQSLPADHQSSDALVDSVTSSDLASA